MLEPGLAHLGVGMVLSGRGKLWPEGVVQCQRVADVPQPGAICLCLPLTNLKIWETESYKYMHIEQEC